jgi:type IV pilus assembly protein PilQ
MIEARIVEATTNFTRELGVQWGGAQTTQSGNRLTTIHGGSTKQNSTDTFANALTGGIGLSGGPFAVNLPAGVGPGRGGSLGISFGNLADTVRLDLQLSALEDTGNGKILSTPRILTLDNKTAKISSGTEILVPTTSIVSSTEATTGVTTIDAKLELSVTPHVTPNGEIIMHVKADKKDPDFARQVQGIPPLDTRTAETNLLVKNGETIVIGGIYTKSTSRSENGVPWLSKIPILGWLFKKQATVESQRELLVFITPTIHETP